MKILKSLASVFVIFYLSGCGYSTHAYIGPYKTIYISPFKNAINIASIKSENANYANYYPLLESNITQGVVDKFIAEGSLKVVDEKDADLILKGELKSYQHDVLNYAPNIEDVKEYRTTLIVDMTLYKAKDMSVIWQKNNFAGDTTYYIIGPQAKTEQDALDDAMKDLSRRVMEAVVEAW